MKLSEQGADFIVRHEGTVTRAYLCPASKVTIGNGYTNGSKSFRAYWTKKHGRPLRLGDTITKEESIRLLPAVANEEYGAAVNRHIKPKLQHQYDGATSVCFNCGPGAAEWKWAKALARGDIRGSARLLKTTAVTARGKKLRGLVRRRREEAALIEDGNYGRAGHPVGKTDGKIGETQFALNKEYQAKLAKLGFDPGQADGIYGDQTKAAVLAFQQKHPDLVNDGMLGRATMAQIDRSLAKRSEPKSTGAAAVVVGAGAVAAAEAFEPAWSIWAIGGAVVVVVAIVGFVIWKYRRDV